MGNPIPPGDGLAPLVDELAEQKRRLRELETFDATQYAKAIEKLQEQQQVLADQQAELEAQISKQVVPVAAHNQVTGFNFPGTAVEIVRNTISVPVGYTRAAVTTIATFSVDSPHAGADIDITGHVDINGIVVGAETRITVMGLGAGMIAAGAATVLTGLTGGSTFYARLVGRSAGPAFGANVDNAANIDSSVVFLR